MIRPSAGSSGASDLKERGFWSDYQAAYQGRYLRYRAFYAHGAFIVPADNKWFTHLIVAAAIGEALHDLDLRIPETDPAQDAELETAWKLLEQEDG